MIEMTKTDAYYELHDGDVSVFERVCNLVESVNDILSYTEPSELGVDSDELSLFLSSWEGAW